VKPLRLPRIVRLPAVLFSQAVAKDPEERARDLLLANLTPEQIDDFLKRGGFYVTASSGQRYLIMRNRNYNVLLGGRYKATAYCAFPMGLPLDDQLLAQKLLLETNEMAFRKIAFSRREIVLL
jgi:hypothetical protein